jgi:uncharacterized protein (DUF4415 family)
VKREPHIVRYTRDDLPRDETDWERVKNLTDEEIEQATREDPDAAPICEDEWSRGADLVVPSHLKHLWVQIDQDLMGWFRETGEDWPRRINAVLRKHVDAQRGAPKKVG